MPERSLRAIAGCCEKCGTTLRRVRTESSIARGGRETMVWRGESSYCPRCGGVNVNWSTATNWSTDTVPRARDIPRFDSPGRRPR